MDGDEAAGETGDAACWLHLLCSWCGAMVDRREPAAGEPARCWRCGQLVAEDIAPERR